MGPGGKIWFVAVLLLCSVLCVRGSTDIDGKFESLVQEEHNLDRGIPTITKHGSDFDYYVFAQQWPGTFCRKSGACCKNVAKPVKFTIHGLWPENEDNSYPSCCKGPGFDEDKVEELYEYLLKNWPTLSCKSPKQCHGGFPGKFGFWKHEHWESSLSESTLPVFRPVYMVDYFNS
ncbi:hypothetical protein R1sor_020388 [Riccia sorocarpa]|uniref:Uncharacterized protein n=1 Tax=Riccia sorocarpa TaxID=122646 RepID=A0ABD3IG00_9MARC